MLSSHRQCIVCFNPSTLYDEKNVRSLPHTSWHHKMAACWRHTLRPRKMRNIQTNLNTYFIYFIYGKYVCELNTMKLCARISISGWDPKSTTKRGTSQTKVAGTWFSTQRSHQMGCKRSPLVGSPVSQVVHTTVWLACDTMSIMTPHRLEAIAL